MIVGSFIYMLYTEIQWNPLTSQTLALAQKCQQLSWHWRDWWWWCCCWWHWWPLPATADSWCDCHSGRWQEESHAISAEFETTLQGHKVQLMAKQALALGSLLVGFAGESLASSSHGFQSCSNGTPYKWQAPTCVPFQGERWHSKVKKAEVRLNWYALSWSETSHVQRECVERFSRRLPVSNCANHHSSNLRSCESIYEYFVFELEINVWIHASNAIIHLCVLQCDFVPL